MLFLEDIRHTNVARFKEQVRVKSSLRKGKLVRAHTRKINKRKSEGSRLAKVLPGVALGAATIGVPVGSYLLLKNRYVKGFQLSARYARAMSRKFPAPDIDPAMKQVTFTVGGITQKAEEGRLIARALRQYAKMDKHHFVPIENKYFKATSNFSPFKEMLGTTLRLGRNPDSIEAAAKAYSYHQKYPDLPINFVGHSAGGMISKEAANILETMGVPAAKIKVVTTGTPDFGIIKNRPQDLNLFTADDPLRYIGARNSRILMGNVQSRVDLRQHNALLYMKKSSSAKSLDVLGEIKYHLGN